jgi:hypothetical protein
LTIQMARRGEAERVAKHVAWPTLQIFNAAFFALNDSPQANHDIAFVHEKPLRGNPCPERSTDRCKPLAAPPRSR